MTGQKITVNSLKYDNVIRRTWNCELVEENEGLLVLLGEFDRDVEHPGLGAIKPGTISYEYFWLDRWYNIFRFHEPDGTLRNYYCNIAMPPTLEDSTINYIDLDIDILVWPDHRYEVVDRDDFDRNSQKYGYPDEIKKNSERSAAELCRMIESRQFPFTEG
jgi:protein associated with RNAse G/E